MSDFIDHIIRFQDDILEKLNLDVKKGEVEVTVPVYLLYFIMNLQNITDYDQTMRILIYGYHHNILIDNMNVTLDTNELQGHHHTEDSANVT